ncbi:MAG: hypothetical protein AAFS04_12270 [Cyanobacteria bacterium J06631_9]
MQALRRLWLSNFRTLRLWLSLLLLGLAFWTVGQLIILQILGRTHQTPRYFITDTQPKGGFQQAVAAIQVEIFNESNTSEAEIVFNDRALETRQLQFALTSPDEIEGAIAQALDMSPQEVSSLVHYKVQNRVP